MPGRRRLLLLTEDPVLAAILPAQLAQDDRFEAEAVTGQEAARLLLHGAPRIAATLLDAALPPGPAEWLARLRDAAQGRPVLVLGEAPGVAPEQRCPKPLRLGDMLDRLRLLLARHEAAAGAVALGGHEFHPAQRRLRTATGAVIRLTEKEAAMLLHLHGAAGRSVPRAELLREVWGYAVGADTHTLETHIYRLRRKLERAGADGGLVRTGEGGYRLTLPGSG